MTASTEAEVENLRIAIESQHGGRATFLMNVGVTEIIDDKVVWQGSVNVFTLEGHPTANRAYAWSHAIDGTDRRRFVTVLHAGPVKSASDAVRAAIVAEHKHS